MKKTNKNRVKEFIRVDHAGERGAIKIYEGQLLALNTFIKDDDLKKKIEKNFDLSPRGIREMLKLNNPIYEITSAYGHFGRKPTNKGEFTWEKTDKKSVFSK